MKRSSAITILLLLAGTCCMAQQDSLRQRGQYVIPRKRITEKAWKLLTGANLQVAKDQSDKEYIRKYIEIGIHRTITIDNGVHAQGAITQGLSIEFAPETKGIFGFKYGAWIEAGLIVFGIDGIYYTNFSQGNFKIRPELGVGAYPCKLTIGYNIPTIANGDFQELTRANLQFTLNVLFRIKTISRTEKDW